MLVVVFGEGEGESLTLGTQLGAKEKKVEGEEKD